MKRIIIDYINCPVEVLNYINYQYPDGYGMSDIISFNNGKGETIEAIEVKTDNFIYLVKINNINLPEKDSKLLDDFDEINEITDIEMPADEDMTEQEETEDSDEFADDIYNC